jgi:hypothetical protein
VKAGRRCDAAQASEARSQNICPVHLIREVTRSDGLGSRHSLKAPRKNFFAKRRMRAGRCDAPKAFGARQVRLSELEETCYAESSSLVLFSGEHARLACSGEPRPLACSSRQLAANRVAISTCAAIMHPAGSRMLQAGSLRSPASKTGALSNHFRCGTRCRAGGLLWPTSLANGFTG